MCQEAIDAIKSLDVAGADSFITCESGGDTPKVVCKFKTIKEAQRFHQALIECGHAARLMESEEQADASR